MNLLFVLCILLGTLQVGTSLFDTFDTSYYKILVDQNGGNFSYWDSKCRGLGDRWAPTIINETEGEDIVLEFGVSDQNKRYFYWIGGSTYIEADRTMGWNHYQTDYTGTRRVRVGLGGGATISFEAAEPSELDTRVICEKTPLNNIGEQGESEGLQFSSTRRKYHLIDRLNYVCADLNENGHIEPWDLVTLETEEEFNLIRAGVGFFPAHYHGKYWHRGRTLVEPSAGAFGYSDYIPTQSLHLAYPRYFVYTGPSTEEEDLPESASYNADEEKFFSSDITHLPLAAGKICEREVTGINIDEGFKFASHQSYYWRLTAASLHDYAYWSSKCEALGDGWGAATFESEGETVFTREAQRGYTDARYYWVAGFTDYELGSTIPYSAYYTTSSNYNNVIVLPCDPISFECNFELISASPLNRTTGILCEKEVVHFGLELASTTNRYRKLFVGNEMNAKTFGRWAHRCSEIGSGWKPAALNTVEEYNFIRIGQKSFINSDSFWLSGSTNLNGTIEFCDYIDNNSGRNGVMASTHRSGTNGIVTKGFNDKNTFILKAQSHDKGLDGVLCEKGVNTNDLEFASAISFYKSIVGSANTHSYYVSKCKELGDGWGATVIESEDEFDFIEQNLKNNQDRDHFVNGSYYDETLYNGHPFSFQAYSPKQLERPLYMTWETVTVEATSQNVRKLSFVGNNDAVGSSGILCEKAKTQINPLED